MVINQVHVHRLSLDKAEDNAPVSRDAHVPLPAPVAGQFHVLGRLRRRQFRQDATDTAGQVLRTSRASSRSAILCSPLCAHLMQHSMPQRHALLQVFRTVLEKPPRGSIDGYSPPPVNTL